ncbi:MAG: peptidoglycan DD-metalloendopeptidase family protein [Pseudomonadales bacterium]|nr:peptidoglycan DD-metalloendopeptidase family protein [Pseudomonadales bacterium]
MTKPCFNYSLLGLALCLFSISLSANAQDAAATEAELAAVTAAITEISDWLETASQQQSTAEQALREAELAVSESNNSINALQRDIAASETQLRDLEEQQSALQVQRDTNRELLEQVLRASYVAGESSFLKTLLNQEDSSEAGRQLHYARVISEFQLTKLEEFRTTLAELDTVNAEVTAELNTLNNQQLRLNEEQQQLQSLQTNREQALAALEADIASRSSELEQLEVNQAELQTLLEEIARAMEGIRSFADVPPLHNARGELPPPVRGPIISGFGSRYGGGSLTRQGIVIGAPVGSPVTAVHPGYVAFADWLRGLGLLVIVDHGEGYVSLYAGNEALAVTAGDWVDRGQIVATSGAGIGSAAGGLYFELRQGGEAQDPSDWLDRDN